MLAGDACPELPVNNNTWIHQDSRWGRNAFLQISLYLCVGEGPVVSLRRGLPLAGLR